MDLKKEAFDAGVKQFDGRCPPAVEFVEYWLICDRRVDAAVASGEPLDEFVEAYYNGWNAAAAAEAAAAALED